jgi:hypothetical protein
MPRKIALARASYSSIFTANSINGIALDISVLVTNVSVIGDRSIGTGIKLYQCLKFLFHYGGGILWSVKYRIEKNDGVGVPLVSGSGKHREIGENMVASLSVLSSELSTRLVAQSLSFIR